MGDPLGVAHPFSSFLILFILKFTKMTHLQIPYVSPIGHDKAYNSDNSTITYTSMRLPLLLLGGWLMFLAAGPLLQSIDPRSAVLDIGILSISLFGVLSGLAAVFCCFWLQELLWQPFKFFRQNFQSHFNQLTSWQQCILYFSVFFLSLYAVLWALAMVL